MKINLTDPLLRFYQTATPPCVSIYYPTHRNGPETRQDPIRMKNLLRSAAERISDFGESEKAEDILRPAWDLLPDIDFWTHQQEGLALLAAPGQFRYFHLPYAVPELAVASDHFYLKPLLPLFSRDEDFYILSLSKNRVQLYEANRYSIHQVRVPGLPDNMADALQSDESKEPGQQRSFGPTIGAKGGLPAAQGTTIFHGHGGEKDVRDDELLRYFRAVNEAVFRHLRDSHLPLVLAGVDYYFPIYREANTYLLLIEGGVPGGTESMTEKELRERAWPVVKPHLNLGQKRMLERFERVAYSNGRGPKKATRALEPTVVAAFEGRIDALVIPRESEVWGEFNEETEEVSREAASPARKRELLDLAAMQTILHGGELFVLSKETMPPDSEVAALLRYSNGLLEETGT